jgi:histidinol phosphatase-like enzyme
MIEKLCDVAELDQERCWLVGDRETDMVAAAAAKIRGGVLIAEAAPPGFASAERFADFRMEISPAASAAIRLANARLRD